MGQILIRDVDDTIIATLQSRAAAHGRSLEEEARDMLASAVRPSRESLLREVLAIRALTPPGPRVLAEDLVRESRDAW